LFKHALVQDAAYGTLLRERRRALHARIADTLERRFTEIIETQPELVARHCTEAGHIEKAALLWGKAGQRSLERSAVVEAVGQLRKGLALVANLPDGVTRVQHELDLQISLGKAMIATKGYHAPETGEALIARIAFANNWTSRPSLSRFCTASGCTSARQVTWRSRVVERKNC
jgi:predicted ATPase